MGTERSKGTDKSGWHGRRSSSRSSGGEGKWGPSTEFSGRVCRVVSHRTGFFSDAELAPRRVPTAPSSGMRACLRGQRAVDERKKAWRLQACVCEHHEDFINRRDTVGVLFSVENQLLRAAVSFWGGGGGGGG